MPKRSRWFRRSNARGVPLWVAYYRRALPRFLLIRRLIAEEAIGRVTSMHVHLTRPLATGQVLADWRLVPEISGGGLFFDLASHAFDLLDFLAGPIVRVAGFSANTGGAYAAEDVTTAAFQFDQGVVGTGVWNFNAGETVDRLTIAGTTGEITTAVFDDIDVTVTRNGTPRGARSPQPAARPPAAHPDDRGRVARAGGLRVHGCQWLAHFVGAR